MEHLGPQALQHSAITWISTHLSTGVWYFDVGIVMGISMIFSWVVSFLADPSAAFAVLKKPFQLWNYKTSYTLHVRYDTVLNRWGDACPMDCPRDNEYLLKAIFAYLEHKKKLVSADIDVIDKDYDWSINRYLQMKKKAVFLKPNPAIIKVDSDISLTVSKEAETGQEKSSSHTNKINIVISSKSSFEACREFARKAYEFWVEAEYKELDQEDEDKKLKYYNVRSIDHEGGGIVWNQFPLGTSRTFNYLFFSEKDKVLALVDNFLRPSRGVRPVRGGPAHKLGFLLYGRPGCGKTSFIKALANYTKRHIFDIHLSKFKKNSELRDAFFSEKVSYADIGGSTQLVEVGLDKRVIIMEDIDALSDVVQRRAAAPSYGRVTRRPARPSGSEGEEGEAEEKKDGGGDKGGAPEPPALSAFEQWRRKKEAAEDALNLGALLSILDGTLELTGPIVVMTTNHPEHLDPALIRSGRVTRQVYFGHLDRQSFLAMLTFYFGPSTPAQLDALLPNWQVDMNDVIPPNDLEAICKNSSSLAEACEQVVEYVYGEGVTIRVDDVRVSTDCRVERVKQGAQNIRWSAI